jgi:hypothetical protein
MYVSRVALLVTLSLSLSLFGGEGGFGQGSGGAGVQCPDLRGARDDPKGETEIASVRLPLLPDPRAKAKQGYEISEAKYESEETKAEARKRKSARWCI